MPWYRRSAIRCWILPDRVFSPFTDELASVLTQVLQQVAPLHGMASWGIKATRMAAFSKR